MPDTYSFNPSSLTYDKNGHPVQTKKIADDVARVALASRNKMRQLAIDLKNKKIPLQTYYELTMSLMKYSYYAAVSAASGKNPDDLKTDVEIAFLLWLLSKQFDTFNDFIGGIESGKVPLDSKFPTRAGMYGMATKSVFENYRLWNAGRSGYQQCKRVLGLAEHCNDSKSRPGCEELAANGWMPIQNMTPIGSATCLSNCRCTIEYRNQNKLSAGSIFQFEQKKIGLIDIRDPQGHLLFKYDPDTNEVEIKHKYMDAARVVDMNTLKVRIDDAH